MCLTLKYLLVISVGLNLGFLIVIGTIILDHRRGRKLNKMEIQEAKRWGEIWKNEFQGMEKKYNSLKDRRRGE